MSWSLKVLTIRGIAVRVHASFLLILVWAAYVGLTESSEQLASGEAGWLRGAGFMVTFVLLLFVCVVLHELGHGLVAQLFGVQVQDITLWPIGGVARMSKMPEKPHQEFFIAAAGPAVNILLTLVLGAVALTWIGPETIATYLLAPRVLAQIMAAMGGQALLLLLTFNNVILVLFNLVPAFPMDGGRLLRSALAAVMPFGQATRLASIVGQALAAIMVVVGLILPGYYLLVLVGLFVFLSAWQERRQATAHEHLAGRRVRQAMQPIGLRLHPVETVGDVVARVAATPQVAFLVIDAGRLVGIISRSDLLSAVRRAGPSVRIGQMMRREVLQFGPDDLLTAAAERLAQQHAPAGVVVEDGQVIGALSRHDLARLAEALDAHPSALPKV